MTTAKDAAKKPADLDIAGAVDEVEDAGKKGKTVKSLLSGPNSTFAQRAAVAGKRIGSATNKAITADESKAK